MPQTPQHQQPSDDAPQAAPATKKSAPRRRRKVNWHLVRVVICCVLLLLLFAALPVFVNTAIGYTPLVAYLIALILSFVYIKVLKRCLTFEAIGADAGCVRGDNLPFALSVTNKSILPAIRIEALFYVSDLFGNAGATTTRHVSLPPRSSKVFDFGVRFDHIGSYDVGIKQIGIYDLLGVFYHVKRNDQLHRVVVKPRLHDIDKVEVSSETAVESKKSMTTVINEGMDYYGVREYRWGDPIKSIHWKLSSRIPQGEFLTRLYETVTNPGVTIFIDLDSLPYSTTQLMDVYDSIVETALSIEHWAGGRGMETQILFADDLGNRRNFAGPFNDNYDRLLECLPRIAAGSGHALVDMLHSEASSIYCQNNLIVCSACITSELINELLSAKVGRRNPILFAATPPGLDKEELRGVESPLHRLESASIPYARISSGADLKGRG